MSNLNAIERECQDVLVVVRDCLAMNYKDTTRHTYMEMMGRIRTAIVHLTNKEYGCLSGRHAGPCSCRKDQAA